MSVRRQLGFRRPIIIQPYRGIGTREQLWIKARVLESGNTRKPSPGDSAFRNALRMFQRYESDEIAGARVRCSFGSQEIVVESDQEGFLEAQFDVEFTTNLNSDDRWRAVQMVLEEPIRSDQNPVEHHGFVLTPPARAKVGIISDIDDTIVHTGAYDLMRHWRTVVTTNAHTRVPFKGLSAFYRALERSQTGEPINPIFYVSSSPWNLYDLFEHYMTLNEIPVGPMFLKDFGLDETKWLTGGHDGHKSGAIERIMATYPDLPFILVGDSGQRDGRIYADIAQRWPDRIRAIYIRDVSDEKRDLELANILSAVDTTRTAIAYGPDLIEAARNAVGNGWITPEELDEVVSEVNAASADAGTNT